MLEQVIISVQIILIDIVMAADNAIIIGLIAAGFASDNRRKIIAWGVAAAFLFRIIFASGANYLKNTGWNYNETWGRKVYIGNLTKTINEKKKYKLNYLKELKLLNFDKKPLPKSNIYARLIFLKNEKKYAYLAYQNFDNILKWNRSNYFAIAVGTLSDHILYGK